jgi:dolichol-phosphate mannosyltransferase
LSEDVATIGLPVRTRVRLGLAQRANWLQLVRFGIVGASGYAVNLAVFAAAVHLLGVNYRVAAVAAFLVAVANNFAWNREWTFGARDGHAGFQAARFFAVSVAAFVVSFVVLQGLVELAGVEKLAAQATAIVVATPLNFVGNKLWSFSQ